MVDFALLEDLRCPHCQGFGVVEVSVEPDLGLASARQEGKTEWRVCACKKGEGLPAQERTGP